MEKQIQEKEDDAVGKQTQTVNTAKKSAKPLTDAEWQELKQLRETQKQNADDREFEVVCPSDEELTDDELTRLNELNQRVDATITDLSADAAQWALLWHEIPDLKRRLDLLGRELRKAEFQRISLQKEYDKLQHELTICEVFKSRISTDEPDRLQAFDDAVTRLDRVIKSAGQGRPGAGCEITDAGIERRIPTEGSTAND